MSHPTSWSLLTEHGVSQEALGRGGQPYLWSPPTGPVLG
jgi:hypothetical protein